MIRDLEGRLDPRDMPREQQKDESQMPLAGTLFDIFMILIYEKLAFHEKFHFGACVIVEDLIDTGTVLLQTLQFADHVWLSI